MNRLRVRSTILLSRDLRVRSVVGLNEDEVTARFGEEVAGYGEAIEEVDQVALDAAAARR